MTMTGRELTLWRQRRNWTVEQAAAWWGCSDRQWQRYERGDTDVPAPMAKRIRNPRHDITYLVDNEAPTQ